MSDARGPAGTPSAPGPSVSAQASPTGDLYLGFCCSDLLKSGELERYAPTVFRHRRTLIVMRHAAGLSRLPDHDRLVYLIDDDWREGLRDRGLPLWYRGRLALREARAASRLEAAADLFVVSSEVLAERYRLRHPGRPVRIIEPSWDGPRADLPAPEVPALRLAVLGAATHRQDNLWIVPVLTALLDADPRLELLWSDNHPLPASLAARRGVLRVPVLTWTGYREWMARSRADIGLYPLGPGPFNRARSINKLGEYDCLGAAVVGSQNWEAARVAAANGACLYLPHEHNAWIEAIGDLLSSPKKVHALAKCNRSWLSIRGMEQQRRRWAEILPGLEPGRNPGKLALTSRREEPE